MNFSLKSSIQTVFNGNNNIQICAKLSKSSYFFSPLSPLACILGRYYPSDFLVDVRGKSVSPGK